ncbi:MAG: hypothetical protein V1746_05220 [bacterium]
MIKSTTQSPMESSSSPAGPAADVAGLIASRKASLPDSGDPNAQEEKPLQQNLPNHV